MQKGLDLQARKQSIQRKIVIQGHSRSSISESMETTSDSMLALSLKAPRIYASEKSLKIAVVDNPTVVWRRLSREPLQISAETVYCQKRESLAYIFAADPDSVAVCLRKAHVFWSRMRNDRSRSSKVVDFGTNWKRICDFPLVINSNIGPMLQYVWDTVT